MGERRSDRRTVMTALHRQRLGRHGRAATGPATGASVSTPAAAGAARPLRSTRRPPERPLRRAGGGLDAAAGETAERCFLLGHAATPTRHASWQCEAAASAGVARRDGWCARATGTTCWAPPPRCTPDPLFDALVNRWLLYQTVSCRLWAKAGFYQAGGATGFRDQLQDAMALAWAAPRPAARADPAAARRASSPKATCSTGGTPGGAGVRTHFSTTCCGCRMPALHYLRTSGDARCWTNGCPSSKARRSPKGARTCTTRRAVSAPRPAVYEHAARAIDHSLRWGARPAADGQRRLERRHEPRRPRGPGRIGVAGLVPVPRGGRLRAAGARTRRHRTRRSAGTRPRRGLAPRCWARPGTAPGTGAPSSTTASRWGRRQRRGRIDLIAQAWAVLSGAARRRAQARRWPRPEACWSTMTPA
jgi:cyclic beta-1,2-glucan synthetase